MKTLVKQNQVGLLFKKGHFIKFVKAGLYHHFPSTFIEVINLNAEISSKYISKRDILEKEGAKDLFDFYEVGDQEYGVHFVDDNYDCFLESGLHIFSKENRVNTFIKTSYKNTKVADDFPIYLFEKIPSKYFISVMIEEFKKGLLFIDGKLSEVLEPGRYFYWKNLQVVTYENIPVRETNIDMTGQEVLTQDKATIRVNIVCNYLVDDPVKVIECYEDYSRQIYLKLQFAARDYVGTKTLDEVLDSRNEMANYIFDAIKDDLKKNYITITEVGIKDIILPGDMRDIMNTVLIATKKAQANVITRREEVASTRSLLNTAKLMEDNPTLYKLKEMEFIEKISDKIGSINVTGSGDIVSQLTSLLKK